RLRRKRGRGLTRRVYFCRCFPPRCDTPAMALPLVRLSSFCATSPSETMPTRRLSRFTTGRRRSWMSPMFFTTCSRSSSSNTYFTSVDMTSRTGVSGPLPSATARIAMSRSVIMPTSRSPSPTGTAPASMSAMIFATSRMLCPGLAMRTSRVIASLTRMETSLLWVVPASKQEIDRYRDGGHGNRDAASDRQRRRGDRGDALLRSSGFHGRNEQGQRGGNRHPAPDVGQQHPAHRAVVAERVFSRARRSAGGVLEQRERIEIDQELPH